MARLTTNWNLPTDPADLLGSSGSAVTLGTSYTPLATSSGVDMDGDKYIVLYVYCSALGGAGRLDLQLEVSEELAGDYVPVQTESVSSGVSTQSDYEIQKAVTGTGAALLVSIPTRGIRFWRIKMKADAGTPAVYVRYSGSGGPV